MTAHDFFRVLSLWACLLSFPLSSFLSLGAVENERAGEGRC